MADRILFTAVASREPRRLPRIVLERMDAQFLDLGDGPRAGGAERLGPDLFRVRVGDYRSAYGIDDTGLELLVVEIAHRREIHRELKRLRLM